MPDKQILFEPIYAWKVWRVITAIENERWIYGQYVLISPLYLYERWPYRSAFSAYPNCWLNSDSKIIEVPHPAPYFFCECGIHALKHKEDAIKYFEREKKFSIQWQVTFAHIKGNVQEKPRECFAIGKVALYGEIVEHERGWRAQYAYPYDLMLIGGDESIAASLREKYQVDVSLKREDVRS